MDKTNEDLSRELYAILREEYEDQFDVVITAQSSLIDPSFLGFLKTYYHLSKIIPEHWVVIDFGAAYNCQGYYFRNHQKSIVVEPVSEHLFEFKNTEIFKGTIANYLEKRPQKEKVFAICNNVPSEERSLIRYYYPDCYVYYTKGLKINKNKNE